MFNPKAYTLEREVNIMANYIYIRVSSKDQNENRQLADAVKLNIPSENIFIDKQSGKDFDRPEYKRMIDTLQENDVVYIHSIDRLGRNYDLIIEEWNRITKVLKANIVVLDMPLLDTTSNNNDLTGKFIADLVLQILSYVAQKERENIKQRQAEGIRIAKQNGKFRKKDIDFSLFMKLDADVKAGILSIPKACAKLGVKSRNTWYKLRKEVAEKSEVCV
jgi:DNA invertase Pin-like site-specific DNA recombinase